MTTETIRPFAEPGYTMFNNAILDHIMPRLSGSGWKILSVAIRQTYGWVDEDSPTGRKLRDRISYSQFLEKSGIVSRSTVSRAIQECLKKRYLRRHPCPDHRQAFEYSLNRDFEMEVETTGKGEYPHLVAKGQGGKAASPSPPDKPRTQKVRQWVEH